MPNVYQSEVEKVERIREANPLVSATRLARHVTYDGGPDHVGGTFYSNYSRIRRYDARGCPSSCYAE